MRRRRTAPLLALAALLTALLAADAPSSPATAAPRAVRGHGMQPAARTGEPVASYALYPIGVPNWYEPSRFQPPGPYSLPGYVETYVQDFRTGGSLPAGWVAFRGTPGGDPGASWSPANVAVRDGMLILTSTRNPDVAHQWISGGVCDCGNPFTYGAVFVRSRITGPGPSQVELLWPANGQWPPELDFAESWGDTNEILGSDHYDGGTALNVEMVDLRKWHTIGIVWTPTSITYVLNGRAWWTFAVPADVPSIPMTLDLTQQTWCSAHWACPGSVQSLEIDWIAEYAPA